MLTAQNIHFYYNNGDFYLHDMSFSLPRGQIVGLLGENGSGKTTLIRCLTGLYYSDGTVTIDGQSGEGIRAKMSYISGEGAVFGNLTPVQVGEFLAEYYEGFNKSRYSQLLKYFDLPDSPVRYMSKGERAKAELAAGFCKGADYILMDEPFSGKDVFTRRDFLKIMAGSLHENETILLSTHLVEEVELFIDRALILHKGSLVADTDLDELRNSGGSLMTLLRECTGYDDKRAADLFA